MPPGSASYKWRSQKGQLGDTTGDSSLDILSDSTLFDGLCGKGVWLVATPPVPPASLLSAFFFFMSLIQLLFLLG